MAFCSRLVLCLCAIYMATGQPVNDSPDSKDRKHITISWRDAPATSDDAAVDRKHITISWRDANATDVHDGGDRKHVTVSWGKSAEAQPAHGPETTDRKHITVSWRGAQLEHPQGGERGHFTVFWRNVNATAAPSNDGDRDGVEGKHHVTFSWRASTAASNNADVGPDGRIQYTFISRKEGSTESQDARKIYWSFPVENKDAEVTNGQTESGDDAATTHHITFAWTDAQDEPTVSTDAGSTAVVSSEPAVAENSTASA